VWKRSRFKVRRILVITLLDRKRFVNALGVAGLGLGMLAATAGVPLALAQEPQSPAIDQPLLQHEESTLDLSDEELRTLLIQLLAEREARQARAGGAGFAGDDVALDMYIVTGDHEKLRTEAYQAFTEALAEELGIDDSDEVDAAIRAAMMANVDANTGLSKRGQEEQKALIAEAEAPIGPTYRGHGG
jgi:hypothetical protein